MEYTDVRVDATIKGDEAAAKEILDAALERIMCPGVEITLQEVRPSARHMLVNDLPRSDVSLKLGSFLGYHCARRVGGMVAGATLGSVAKKTKSEFTQLLTSQPLANRELLLEQIETLLKKYDLEFAR